MYIDNEVLEKMIMTMVEGFNRLEKKLDRMNRLKDCLDGDTLLDNCDLAQLLGVTQRTIARLASRMARGQFRIASSLTVMIVGSAMIAKTILPANPVSPTGRLKTF